MGFIYLSTFVANRCLDNGGPTVLNDKIFTFIILKDAVIF